MRRPLSLSLSLGSPLSLRVLARTAGLILIFAARVTFGGGSTVPFLPVKQEFHPKRNQARQKLASLTKNRFKDLASDVYHELQRRNPDFLSNKEAGQEVGSPPSFLTVKQAVLTILLPQPGADGERPPISAQRSKRRVQRSRHVALSVDLCLF